MSDSLLSSPELVVAVHDAEVLVVVETGPRRTAGADLVLKILGLEYLAA